MEGSWFFPSAAEKADKSRRKDKYELMKKFGDASKEYRDMKKNNPNDPGLAAARAKQKKHAISISGYPGMKHWSDFGKKDK